MPVDSVTGAPTFTTTYTTSTQQTNQVDGRDITGNGLVGQSGSIPMSPNDPSYGAVLESIARLIPEIAGDMLDLVLLEITTKMKEIEEDSQKDSIKIQNEAKRSAIAEKMDKLKEAMAKMKEAEDKEKNASIWDKIKMAFQAITAALMIVAGALLAAVPGFQAIGALMIMSGVLSAIMLADTITAQETGMGMMGNLFKAMGASEDVCKGMDIAFKVYLCVAAVVTAVAGFFVNPMGTATAVTNMIQAASTWGSAAVNIATAGGDIYAGVTRYQAANLTGEATNLRADAKRMEAVLSQIEDFIDQALERLKGCTDRGAAMLESLMDAIREVAKGPSTRRFTG